ncbi:MAG: metallophosphoesterase family protein [Janthinobacterium lividum]
MIKHTLFAALLAASLASSAFASSTVLLNPAPTPSAAITPPADPDHFMFVVGGDNRSTGHGYPMPPVWATICREIGYIQPAFVLTTGDAIEGYGDTPAEANAEYDVFLQDVSLTGVPVYCAAGNHEFSLDPALVPVYEKRLGKLYGSFDYGHSHFIAVNSNPVGADGSVKGGTIDDAEFTWLESDLEANKRDREYVCLPAPLCLWTARPGYAGLEHRLCKYSRSRPASCADGQVQSPGRVLRPQPHLLAQSG